MIRRFDSQFCCTWLCLLLETSRRKSRDKPLLRERLWELGVMRTERRWQKEHQLATVRMYVHIRKTFSSSGLSTQEVEGTLQEEPSLSRLSSPLGDTRELWAMKRECLFANRQHILHYAISLLQAQQLKITTVYLLRVSQGFCKLLAGRILRQNAKSTANAFNLLAQLMLL